MSETSQSRGDNENEGFSSEISSISSGAIFFAVGMLFESLIRVFINLLLTRNISTSMYGTFSYSRTIFNIFRVLAKVGSGESLTKFVPQYSKDRDAQNIIIGLAFFTSLIGSGLIGGILYIISPYINEMTINNGVFTQVLRIFVLMIPFASIIAIVASIFRGLEKPKFQIGIQRGIYPLAQLFAVSVAIAIGFNLEGTVTAILLGTVVSAILSLLSLYLYTNIGISFTRKYEELIEYYNYSLPLSLSSAGSLLYSKVDIIMVGFFLSDTDVGVYSVAILVSTFMGMPLSGLNQLFPPIASRLHSENKRRKLKSIFQTTTRWAFTFSLYFGITVGIYNKEVLAIFGESYTAGSTVLILFLFAQLTRNGVGPSGYMLMMTGHQYMVMLNRWILGSLNILLNYFLILEYGFIGAALGSASSLTIVNIVRVIQVYYFEGYLPYTSSFFKPILAGFLSGIAMLSFSYVLQGMNLLLIGSIVGCFVYFITLFWTGLGQQEEALLTNLIDNLK